MEDIESTIPIIEGKEFAICVYALQRYAGLSFNEAYTYVWMELGRPPHVFGISRQALHSRLKNARRKIAACEAPVLEIIEPYVKAAPLLWVD